jgi:hypothetical protein
VDAGRTTVACSTGSWLPQPERPPPRQTQRAVATQDDTRAANYRAMVISAAVMLWPPAQPLDTLDLNLEILVAVQPGSCRRMPPVRKESRTRVSQLGGWVLAGSMRSSSSRWTG